MGAPPHLLAFPAARVAAQPSPGTGPESAFKRESTCHPSGKADDVVTVSVVVAVRNEAERLPGCLAALAAQTLPPERFEAIFVDGESVDGSRALIARAGYRVHEASDPGVSAARNAGIHAATGDVVAFTDADCRPAADWVGRIAERFETDPGLAGLGGMIRHRSDRRAPVTARLEDALAVRCYSGYLTSNVAYRRDVLLESGGFDPSLRCAEDSDLAWRIAGAGGRLAFDPALEVVHEPPEERSVRAWLAKHAWYGRHDVPALLRGASRATRAGAPSDLRASYRPHARAAAVDAGGALLLVAGSLASRPSVAASALALAAGRGIATARALAGASTLSAPVVAGLWSARVLVRGLGALAGLADAAARIAPRAAQRARERMSRNDYMRSAPMPPA